MGYVSKISKMNEKFKNLGGIVDFLILQCLLTILHFSNFSGKLWQEYWKIKNSGAPKAGEIFKNKR